MVREKRKREGRMNAEAKESLGFLFVFLSFFCFSLFFFLLLALVSFFFFFSLLCLFLLSQSSFSFLSSLSLYFHIDDVRVSAVFLLLFSILEEENALLINEVHLQFCLFSLLFSETEYFQQSLKT